MRLGLVLSGGGAKGAFEAGVFAAMEDAGLRPAVVSGTSAGALNAAGIAAGFDAARLAELWTSTTEREIYRLRRDVHRLVRLDRLFARGGGPPGERFLESLAWTWLLDTAPLRATLEGVLGGSVVPVQPDVVCTVTAVDIALGDVVRFTSAPPPAHRADPRFRVVDLHIDHLLASAAIPILFRPGVVAGSAFWDGGVVANTPLAPALAYEPDAVVVVTTSTVARPAAYPRTFPQAVSLLFDTILRYSLLADLARAETVNELCRVAPEATEKRCVEFLLIEPVGVALPPGGFLRFDPRRAAELVALGRALGAKALARWEGSGGV